MTEFKRIKDPIYGYIKIPVRYVEDIIDTPEFQRIRRIIQTSYAPLYSTSLHNRFVHSLGVFYLGNFASSILAKQIKSKEINVEIDRIVEIFNLACLLHDVGHAPFSHTGESFFLDEEGNSKKLHTLLCNVVNESQFTSDISDSSMVYTAAPMK